MSTAPLIPTDEQLSQAYAARTVPDRLKVLGDPVQRLQRRPPEEWYVQQEYRFRFGRRDLLLSPSPAREGNGLPIAKWRVPEPVHFLTAWNPLGRAGTFSGLQGHQKLLGEELRRRGLKVSPAAALAANGGWFEATLLVRGLSDEEAVDVAREVGQAAAIGWDEETVRVLPTGLEDAVVTASQPVTLYRLPSRTCPARRDADPAGRCVPYGGGWTSGSIHAACLWQEHRYVGIQLLGCDSCDNGQEPIWGSGGRAISFEDPLLASRFGNATWLP